MLINCFVETRESRIADFSLEKITANVLGNISPNNKDVDKELANLIEMSVEVESGQTIFIVGPTGAGKSAFLDRFFRKTLSNKLRQQCLVVRVNCLDASGREKTVLRWLTEQLIACLEELLYAAGHPHGTSVKDYIMQNTNVGPRVWMLISTNAIEVHSKRSLGVIWIAVLKVIEKDI